jgi:hypothetical protein
MVCVTTYSLVGEYVLDMHHIFSQHLPNTPRDGTVEYELDKLEQVVGNARISLNENEYDTEDE